VRFEVASEYDLVDVSPVRRKLHRPQGGAKKKLALTPAQLRGIIDNAKEEYRPLFLMAAITGLRLGDVQGLRWANVDLLDGKLSVTHSLWRDQLMKPKTDQCEDHSLARILGRTPTVISHAIRVHKLI